MRLSKRFAAAVIVVAVLMISVVPILTNARTGQSEATASSSPTIMDRHHLPVADFAPPNPAVRSVSILDDRRGPHTSLQTGTAVSPGIEICGGPLGGTTYDYQANDDNQRMIALTGEPGDPYVNFVWTHWDVVPGSLDAVDRFVATNCWSQSGGLGLGNCGFTFGEGFEGDPLKARFGFPTIDVASDGQPHIAMQAKNADEQALGADGRYSSWIFNATTQCFNSFGLEELASSVEPEAIWPHIAVDRGGSSTRTPGDDVFHVVSHQNYNDHLFTGRRLFYWRRVGAFGNSWEGPAILDEEIPALNHHMAVDPTSERVAVFYERGNLDPYDRFQVGYLESPDNGANWIATGVPIFPDPVEPIVGPYVPITSYTGPDLASPDAWVECSGEYDYDGVRHAVWIEQAYASGSSDCRVMHWDDVHGTRIVREALGWGNVGRQGGRDLWLALPNIAFGDGSTTCTEGPGDLSNYDYVYITYHQYGGPTAVEANDVSVNNYQNLELYLAVSNDAGNSFSQSLNLTNTKSPGCDGTVPASKCASERDASMARIINDTIHIQYILDTDAGDVVFGQGAWTFNPVMYYRIPGGTDAEYLCPPVTPVIDARLDNPDPDCEYHAGLTVPPLQTSVDLLIQNFGNAALTGVITTALSSDWLQLTTGAYTVLQGDPPDVRTVTMDATTPTIVTEGLYQDSIVITHNDTTQTSPVTIPVDFFVFDEFYCPEYVTLHTGWLWLAVSNVEAQGDRTEVGGLSRLDPIVGDSSSAIYEASLLIGTPPDPDTLVYRMLSGSGNGQPGFRALGSLEVDTSTYGTGSYAATARATQTTVDSTIGVDVEYVFPQHPDSCEFVIVKYAITNNTLVPMTNLIIGQATDFDVTPGENSSQAYDGPRPQNTGSLVADYNLIYAQGSDSAGHVIDGDTTATRYRAGVTALQTLPSPRAWVAPSAQWLVPGAMGTYSWPEGYLYKEMTKFGFELFPMGDPADLHTAIVFDNNVDLDPGETKYFQVGYVSSNTGADEADLIAATRKAWRYCFGWNAFTVYDSIPNPATPQSYPYYAIGTHENGIAGGCTGCIVSELEDYYAAFSIVPESDQCYGTIEFNGTVDDRVYPATFRVTDMCGSYIDDISIEVVVGEPLRCDCPLQGDLDGNGIIDPVDFNLLIQVLFFNAPDPQDIACPITRSDWNGDAQSDAVDLGLTIDYLYFNANGPCDPCENFGLGCLF